MQDVFPSGVNDMSLNRSYVALDLETTGLEATRDHIIEIGAIKFQGEKVVDTWSSYVNPYRRIPQFVERLTGITTADVEHAPPFAVVAGEIEQFIGSLPLVGHNISFDLEFLSKAGLPLSNRNYDTLDLAKILIPGGVQYSLSVLAKHLGINHERPHRALDDADITRRIFLMLLGRIGALDPKVIGSVNALATKARWGLKDLFVAFGNGPSITRFENSDFSSLSKKPYRPKKLLRNTLKSTSLDLTELEDLVDQGGLLPRMFEGFEHRPQQAEMLQAVATSLNNREHLIVEAGTGVGKSVAYLLPAILFAVRNGVRVVISTNTINLQEQILYKDIPALVKVLEAGGLLQENQLSVCALKGRSNYLCLRRWNNLAFGEVLSIDDARLLSKSLVWAQGTETGDKGELNLAGRDMGLWNRISAGDRGRCPGLMEGGCFLRAARERAEDAHIVVVNHALLLSNVVRGGSLIPDFKHLIIDEAHHLEEEATQQLGFQLSESWLPEQLEELKRWLLQTRILLNKPAYSDLQRNQCESLIKGIEGTLNSTSKGWASLWSTLEDLALSKQSGGTDRIQLRITSGIRTQPIWSDMEIILDNWHISLTESENQVNQLITYLDLLAQNESHEQDTLLTSLTTWLQNSEELKERFQSMTDVSGQRERIDWIDQGIDSSLILHSVPKDVGLTLETELFNEKDTVVFTSATLRTQGSFEFIRERLGIEDVQELAVGSPFDYKQTVLLAAPDDIPEPSARGYREALEKGIESLVRATGGHALVLFTSHSAIRSARQMLIETLEPEGMKVIAQGVDGSAARVISSFREQPRSVLLGTSSLWEGVDLPTGIIKLVVLARLPFNVPTDPVFAARSEDYEDAFNQYAVPQAVLRFRQGFGRLIRRGNDHGAVAVMDRRVLTKAYGRAFLDSLPECEFIQGPMWSVAREVSTWLSRTR
ncbi:DEAD/DEAH box helicase [SAR202 cluster bacterium AD-804-J14_MRT_500m]|nr:DEAD/DEAH box helicase [SAR202 cluster bacterium AD-804-J14_MRT_500m]